MVKHERMDTLLAETAKAKKQSDYMSSPGALARETIKGIPSAAKIVINKVVKYSRLGKAADNLQKKSKAYYR